MTSRKNNQTSGPRPSGVKKNTAKPKAKQDQPTTPNTEEEEAREKRRKGYFVNGSRRYRAKKRARLESLESKVNDLTKEVEELRREKDGKGSFADANSVVGDGLQGLGLSSGRGRDGEDFYLTEKDIISIPGNDPLLEVDHSSDPNALADFWYTMSKDLESKLGSAIGILGTHLMDSGGEASVRNAMRDLEMVGISVGQGGVRTIPMDYGFPTSNGQSLSVQQDWNVTALLPEQVEFVGSLHPHHSFQEVGDGFSLGVGSINQSPGSLNNDFENLLVTGSTPGSGVLNPVDITSFTSAEAHDDLLSQLPNLPLATLPPSELSIFSLTNPYSYNPL